MLIEAVTDLEVDLQAVEREKQLIWLETLALYEDPLWLTKTAVEAKLFEGTPYAHPPTGWLETLRQLSFTDAQQFHRTHFVSPNFALTAIVPSKETLTFLKDAMAQMPTTTGVVATPVSLSDRRFMPSFEVLIREALTRPNEAFWGMGWRIPIKAKDKVAVDALVMHLRQVLLPTLFGHFGVVREWNMLANPVRGEIALTITAQLRPHHRLLEDRLEQLLDELARRNLTSAEMKSLKRSLRLEHLRVLSNPMRCARELGWAWALYNDPTIVKRYTMSLEELDAEQIRQTAKRLASTKPVVWMFKK
ncbi:MAG: hypothetical protein N2116_03005 [Armatimonadetes bacterium]|nr:hypothetical protein [Armatimonadota bacterium]